MTWAARRLSGLVGLGCGLMAALLALSWLATRVSPERYGILEVFGLLGWVFVLIGVFMLLLAVFFRAILGVLLLVVLVITGNSLALKLFRWPWATGTTVSAPDGAFRVMTYNVQNFDFQGPARDSSAANRAVACVGQVAPAVLCLQEFYTDELTEMALTRKLLAEGFVNYRYYRSLELRKQESIGIATFSRWPIIGESQVSFGDSTQNSALITDVVTGTDTLRIINVHMESNRLSSTEYDPESGPTTDRLQLVGMARHLYQAAQRRALQAERMHALVAASPYAVILCGDFNDTPSTYAYRTLATGLDDSFLERGRGMGPTYAGRLPGLRIDYILFNKGMRCYSHTVPHVDYSDHYPVIAELSR